VKGDPDKFLFILYFGEVKCWYLGGQWDASEGGEWEDFLPQMFKSPACNKGYSAGETVAVEGHLHARVVRGNPHFDTTEISVRVPVLAWDDGSYDHEDHHGYHGWHKHDGHRWHRHR
jgi:hypothetical protein